jgi:hypothetical protein
MCLFVFRRVCACATVSRPSIRIQIGCGVLGFMFVCCFGSVFVFFLQVVCLLL